MKKLGFFSWLGLVALATTLLTACGDVDKNSTTVSQDVRPAATIQSAQQNNNTGTGLPTDPTKSSVQAGGATATALPPTPTPKPGDTPASATTAPASGGATTQAGGATTAANGGNSGAGAGDATAGLAVFKSAGCSGCHSGLGKTAGGVGPKLAGTTRDDQYIANIIRNGKNAMPAHATDEVSDKDITNLTAYIRSLK